MKYERQVCQLLRRLGVNSSYVGFRYAFRAILLNMQNPERVTYISKGLYAEIAAEFHTTVSCVERDIRTVVTIIWLHGDHDLLDELFGFHVSGRPRNASFIDAVSHYLMVQNEESLSQIQTPNA